MRALCLMMLLIAFSFPVAANAADPQRPARHVAKHKHVIHYQWRGKGHAVRLAPAVTSRPIYLNTRTYSPYGYTPIPSSDYYVPPPAWLPPESDPDFSGPEPQIPF